MPFPDVLELVHYWQEFPPTHLLVRAWVGFKPQTPVNRERASLSSAEQRWMAQASEPTPASGIPPAIQDFIKKHSKVN